MARWIRSRSVVRSFVESARTFPTSCRTASFATRCRSIFDEILDAFPTDQAVPEARAAFERGRRELCDGLRDLPVID